MVKDTTKRRQQPQAVSPSQSGPAYPLGYDPAGKIEPVDIVGSKDGWSEYTLIDGAVLRVKAAVFDVKSAVGQYAPNGDPIYLVQSALVIQVKAPESLKRGG
jgi:hypothetical protein